ncbi:hypothetical protein VCSRO199_1054 [Vibrio cholerae]|nr:hypothetical protein VCSRO199_1054 [Vibrio cholerae]
MLSYVKKFSFCHKNHIINDGNECFTFASEDLNYIQELSVLQGTVIENSKLPELYYESCPYDLVIRQSQDNQIAKPVIYTDLPFDFDKGISPLFNEKGDKKLSIFIFKDIEKYWSEINRKDNNDYRMGIFFTNEQINISHFESHNDHTPCLKCHYLNTLGNHIEEDRRNNEWQQFFHYLMKNDLGQLTTRALTDSEYALILGILYQVTASRVLSGYCNHDGFSRFDCGAIHLTSLSKTKAKMYWNYMCGCSNYE